MDSIQNEAAALKGEISVWFCLCLLSPSALGDDFADARAKRASKIKQEATISFVGSCKVACSKTLVEAVLERPQLMAALWSSYGYSPTYNVTPPDKSGGMFVKDGTGIQGTVWLVSASGERRVYLAEGKVDHWAVPALNEGTVVFELEVRAAGKNTHIKISIHLKPDKAREPDCGRYPLGAFADRQIPHQ